MTPDRRVVPFKRWHYDWLASRSPVEGPIGLRVTEDLLANLEALDSWTGVVEGDPLVCAGTMQQWPGRHTAWAYVRPGALPHMQWVTEEVKRALDKLKGRIEFTVRKDFRAGLRWARELGFEVETPLLKAYGPRQEDHVGLVRFN
jgi:hypothetical protein